MSRAGRLPCAVGVLLLAACRGQDVHAVFSYDAPAGAHEITALAAVVAGDKAHRPNIQPGERFDMDFRADAGSSRIVVNYIVGEKSFAWGGPEIPAGKRYDIEIQIGAGHSVRSRHCIRPCDLERVKLEEAQPAAELRPGGPPPGGG